MVAKNSDYGGGPVYKIVSKNCKLTDQCNDGRTIQLSKSIGYDKLILCLDLADTIKTQGKKTTAPAIVR
jgi:hypothetical protein